MVNTRRGSVDSLSSKINKLKVCFAQPIKSSDVQRRSGICKRFDPPSEEPKLVTKTPRGRRKKRVEYELPDYTQWFDIDSINYIEEECADNIFIGYGHDRDALHEVYKRVRNKIVELYRIEPTKLLTVTDCIRRLGMDASIVMKVHSLLNYWGIINFQATNNLGEKLFNKRLNEQVIDLKGNQSNIHKKRVKLNFNQILDKDSTEASINTYYNNLSYNDYTKYSNCSKRRFDFNSIEDVVRYSSEFNSGRYRMNLNYPMCSGCSNPCKTSYYILGPDSLGEVNNTVRNRGLWCSLCYCNSNYPITLSKDSFVRIDLPPRLSETISKLFEKNRHLFNEKNTGDSSDGNFRKNGINKGGSGTKPQNRLIDYDDDSEEYVTSSNEEDFIGNFVDDNVDPNVIDDDSDGGNDSDGNVDGTSSVQMREKMQNRLNEITALMDNRQDGFSTVYGSPLSTSNPKNPDGLSASTNSYDVTQRSNDEYDSCPGDRSNSSPKIHSGSDNNDESIGVNQGRRKTSNNSTDMSRFGMSNVKMPWTTDDFERLYEAIRKYGTDWQSVAQHMGEESTPNECVFQFINAPLEKEVTSKLKLSTYMDPPTTRLFGPEFPFFDSPNTIVTLLSFCASVVSPVVASYAAKAAFNIILKSLKKTSIDGTEEGAQLHALDSKDNSTDASVYSNSGNALDDSLNHIYTEMNGVNELRNGTLPNDFNKDTHVNSVNGTSSNTRNDKYEGEESMNNHANDTEGTVSPNGISRDDSGKITERSSEVEDGMNTEGDPQNKGRTNKFIDGTTLQLAAAAALGAAAARASELAEKEQEKLSEALPHLISLRIKRITEKLNRYNETQEQMKSDQTHLEKELFRILKCKGIFQNNS